MMTFESRSTPLSIAGRVTQADNQMPIVGAMVEIMSGPEAFEIKRDAKLAILRKGQKVRHIREFNLTTTRKDGSYRFINLPVGDYQLRCFVPSPTVFEPKLIEVVRVEAEESGFPPMTNFELSTR